MPSNPSLSSPGRIVVNSTHQKDKRMRVWTGSWKATAPGRGTYLPQFLTAGPCSCPFPHMKGRQSQCVYMHMHTWVCVCVHAQETWKRKATTDIAKNYSVPRKSVLRWCKTLPEQLCECWEWVCGKEWFICFLLKLRTHVKRFCSSAAALSLTVDGSWTFRGGCQRDTHGCLSDLSSVCQGYIRWAPPRRSWVELHKDSVFTFPHQ